MRRPSDQTYSHESPEGKSEDEDMERRRRSPAFRRTPGASRPRKGGPGSGPPRPPYPGYLLNWESNSKSAFHSPPVHPPGQSPRMLHASDLCCGDKESSSGGNVNESMFQDEDGEPRSLTAGAVELRVNNLDYNISAREWKKILVAEFVEHVKVLDAYIQTQADNTNVGYIRLGSIDEARFAISKLHRKKVGYKRIHVSLVDESNSSTPNTKSEVVGLLKEVSDNSLPLYKFIHMFEKRFHRGISVSELYRMKNTIQIEDKEGFGRTLSLPPKSSSTHEDSEDEEQDENGWLESPVCKTHCAEGSPSYVAAIDADCLPNVIMQLKTFSAQVHTLLQSHDGNMALMSFQCCFGSEFKSLAVTEEGGVPVEHLISCVPGVKITITRSGIKKLHWAENKPTGPTTKNSPMTTESLAQFGREVVDLLKHSPQCRLSFVKFIPAYHRFLGRQCRVADYGYTKLMELLEAIPNVVQVIGSGNRRVVMLSHRSQVKRFTTDLLRVLKSQISKQISITDLPVIYNVVNGRPFNITDYGVCFIEDMLSEVPESTVQIQGAGQEMVILITRREQTLAEQELTQQFAVEVIDLLSHSPHCRMSFNKFIPAYHHHFGKQCRVADYGFVKLLDLFEAIPNVVQIEEEEEDKVLCLVDDELFKVLEEQVASLLKSKQNYELPVPEFLNAFRRRHGHSLRLQDYGVSSVTALIKNIPRTATIQQVNGHSVIRLIDHEEEHELARRMMLLLMEQCTGVLPVGELFSRYSMKYGADLTLEEINSLHQYVQVFETDDGKGMQVKLTSLQMFARDIRTLLLINKCRLSLQHIEPVFAHYYGVALVPQSYGYPSLYALIQSIPLVVTLKGKGYRRMALLTPEFQGTDNTDAAVQWQSVSNHVPITSPSGDSGITDCNDLSPSRDRAVMGDSMASPVLPGKPGISNQSVGSYQYNTNPPVSEMLSSYSDGMNEAYGGGVSPEVMSQNTNSYNSQYNLQHDYHAHPAYPHDISVGEGGDKLGWYTNPAYLPPPPLCMGGEGGQEAFYPPYPPYEYIQGGQCMHYGSTMEFYGHHNGVPPLQFPTECDPGIMYMVPSPTKNDTQGINPPYNTPEVLNMKVQPAFPTTIHNNVGKSTPSAANPREGNTITLEAASAKLKNLVISTPPPQMMTKSEPWVSDLNQIEEVKSDEDVDLNNNGMLMPDQHNQKNIEGSLGTTNAGKSNSNNVAPSPDSVKSEGRNDSGCLEDEDFLEKDEGASPTYKLPSSPRKPRLAAKFNCLNESLVDGQSTPRPDIRA